MKDFDSLLQAANQRLKTARLGVSLLKRKNKLDLRSSHLPPKPGSERTENCRQEIALGCFANPAGLKLVDFAANSLLPGIQVPPLKAIAVTIPNYIGTSVAINIANITNPISITAGNVTFQNALNPYSPTSGEFVYDAISNTVVLYPTDQNPLIPGLNIQIVGNSSDIVATDVVSADLLSALYGLPVIGTVTWDCSLEQHPTGRINLTLLRGSITAVRNRFKKGKILEIATIAFSVATYAEKLVNIHAAPEQPAL